MAVAVFSPTAVVLAGRATVGGGRERHHPADVRESVVLDMPVRDRQESPRGAGDGSRSGVGLQRPGIGEPRTVVTDSSEHPYAGRVRQPGETDDDRIVRMGLEQLRSRPRRVFDAVAGGVQRREQGAGGLAHRGFDQNRLVQLRFPQLSFDLGGRPLDAAAAAGVAWIWLQQALAAHGKTGDFYKGKRLTTRHSFHHKLQRTTAQFDLSTATTEPRPIWTKTGSSVADARARRCAGPQCPSATSPFGCRIGKPTRRLGELT